MAFAGRRGWDIDIEDENLLGALFSEELGLVVQVEASEVFEVTERYRPLRVLAWAS